MKSSTLPLVLIRSINLRTMLLLVLLLPALFPAQAALAEGSTAAQSETSTKVLTGQAEAAHRIEEEGVTAPKLIRTVLPEYTPEATRAGIQGEVYIEAVVTAEGKVVEPKLVRGLEDEELNRRALESIVEWQFEPGLKDGEPVPVIALFTVTFRIHGQGGESEADQEVDVAALDGRWLFQAVSEEGERTAVLLLDISTEGDAPKATVVGVPLDTRTRVRSFEVEGTGLTLVVMVSRGTLSFEAEIGEGVIEGTIEGYPFDGQALLAERSELDALVWPGEPGRADYDAFRAARSIRNPEERLGALEKILEEHPESSWLDSVWLEIFMVQVGQEVDDEVLREAAENAVGESPVPFIGAQTQYRVANALVARANPPRLLDLAEKYARNAVASLEMSPQRGTYMDTLGQVLLHTGQLDEAEECLREALEIEPDDARITGHLAEVLDAKGESEKARDLYLKAYVNGGSSDAKEKLEAIYEAEHGSLEGLHELLDGEFLKRGLPFEPGEYEGEASPNIVLAELFTGADCGPCLAADFAFDGLLEHYPDNVLAVLEYHLHIPRPDPMTNAASLARKEYYGVNSTPQAYFGGTGYRGGGGGASRAELVFGEYKDLIEERLGNLPPVQLSGEASLQGDDVWVELRAELSSDAGAELAESGGLDALRLHVVLAEHTVHFTGTNSVHFHKQVVRKLMSGAEGAPLGLGEDGSASYEARQNLPELEAELLEYLESYQKEEEIEFRELTTKLNRAELNVVVFVQNTATNEVLTAVTLPLH